ncbi:MAG: EutN/CcmL family microcompartment protein [Gemmatimonadota bacterium]|nr:EutN/CcmL family microcompartment protein [Gemmatimonadota bacterium]
MILARVIGSVVSTLKHPAYDAAKLMLVQPVRPDGSEVDDTLLAVDAAGAGAGETVLVLRQGIAAAQVLGVDRPPIRSVIVGIVDQVVCEPQTQDDRSHRQPAP